MNNATRWSNKIHRSGQFSVQNISHIFIKQRKLRLSRSESTTTQSSTHFKLTTALVKCEK